MTKKEAIEILKDLKIFDDDCEIDCKALDMGIEALEKQIPKKVEEAGEDWFVCPNCKAEIIVLDELETHNFCLICGQALDWSDTE